MRRKLNILLAVIVVMLGLAACGDTSVKYVDEDADVIDGGYSTEYEDNQQQTLSTGTSTDCQEYEDDWSGSAKIPVYVCGAVQKPGVYYLSPTALKKDALDMAGGFVEDAATDYINLAEVVISGEKIYFPYIYELQEGYNMNTGETEDGSSRFVNINTATKDELMTLPGIGESKAEAIIKYRDKNGPFQNIEDITNIPGIKEGVYNNIKEHIVVN